MIIAFLLSALREYGLMRKGKFVDWSVFICVYSSGSSTELKLCLVNLRSQCVMLHNLNRTLFFVIALICGMLGEFKSFRFPLSWIIGWQEWHFGNPFWYVELSFIYLFTTVIYLFIYWNAFTEMRCDVCLWFSFRMINWIVTDEGNICTF